MQPWRLQDDLLSSILLDKVLLCMLSHDHYWTPMSTYAHLSLCPLVFCIFRCIHSCASRLYQFSYGSQISSFLPMFTYIYSCCNIQKCLYDSRKLNIHEDNQWLSCWLMNLKVIEILYYIMLCMYELISCRA